MVSIYNQLTLPLSSVFKFSSQWIWHPPHNQEIKLRPGPAMEDHQETASTKSAVLGTVQNLYKVSYGQISSKGSNYESIPAVEISECQMLEADMHPMTPSKVNSFVNGR